MKFYNIIKGENSDLQDMVTLLNWDKERIIRKRSGLPPDDTTPSTKMDEVLSVKGILYLGDYYKSAYKNKVVVENNFEDLEKDCVITQIIVPELADDECLIFLTLPFEKDFAKMAKDLLIAKYPLQFEE